MKILLEDALGLYGRDVVTGFDGTVTACAIYISGCHQLAITPKARKAGDLPETQWFDQGRVHLGKRAVKREQLVAAESPGGPQGTAPNREHPIRA